MIRNFWKILKFRIHQKLFETLSRCIVIFFLMKILEPHFYRMKTLLKSIHIIPNTKEIFQYQFNFSIKKYYRNIFRFLLPHLQLFSNHSPSFVYRSQKHFNRSHDKKTTSIIKIKISIIHRQFLTIQQSLTRITAFPNNLHRYGRSIKIQRSYNRWRGESGGWVIFIETGGEVEPIYTGSERRVDH